MEEEVEEEEKGEREDGGNRVVGNPPKSGMGSASLAHMLIYSQSAIFVYRCSLDLPCN